MLLIDVPLQPSPNLYPAYGTVAPTPGWTCHWAEFHAALHHSTFLAGYIDGESSTYGFKGLAPSVTVSGFEWAKQKSAGSDDLVASTADRSLRLADLINAHSLDGGPQRVFVAAVDFDPWDRSLVLGQLRNADLRFTRKLEKTIRDRRPLLIVAAGQPSDGSDPVPLSPQAPLFPQNLGDLPNVIVVSACDPCSPAHPRLIPQANFGTGEQRYVHVAAPGSPTPGWISENAIGAGTGGTSESAAYVAGIVAAMISYFPDSYNEPAAVKSRLQVTSRPLPRWIDGNRSDDPDKIAAGIVDPVLALLDPSAHWLKDGGKYRKVKIKAWSANTFLFQNPSNDHDNYVSTNAIRRITQSADGANWVAVYSDRSLDRAVEGDAEPAPGEVRRISPAVVAKQPAQTITLCDVAGGPTRQRSLPDIDDLIISIKGVGDNECGR